MPYSELTRRYVAEEAHRRMRRRSEVWAQARAERERWRAEMVPPAVAAALLGIHRNTLARWVKAGRLTGYKLGPAAQSPVRFRRSDLDRLKATMRGDPVPDVVDPVPPPPA